MFASLEEAVRAVEGGETDVELRSKRLGDDGAKALARAVEKSGAVQTLDLYGNAIGAEGAKALARALEKSATFRSLHMLLNEIGDEGAKALAGVPLDLPSQVQAPLRVRRTDGLPTRTQRPSPSLGRPQDGSLPRGSSRLPLRRTRTAPGSS